MRTYNAIHKRRIMFFRTQPLPSLVTIINLLDNTTHHNRPPAITIPNRPQLRILSPQLPRTSKNLRLPDLPRVLLLEALHIDIAPAAFFDSSHVELLPAKEVGHVHGHICFFSEVVSEEAGIVEFPTQRIVDVEHGGIGGGGASDVSGFGGKRGFVAGWGAVPREVL
jgi:hypothetical protein